MPKELKVSCSCSADGQNGMCQHSMAVAMQEKGVERMVSQFAGRSLTKVATLTVQRSVSSKGSSRKQKTIGHMAAPWVSDECHDQDQLIS